jgi:hypothetical protein
MAKLLQLSILMALVAIPARAARDPNPAKGLRRALVRTAYFNVFYLIFLTLLYGHLAS